MWSETPQNGARLRRALGGRLWTYRPGKHAVQGRLTGIRKALCRGELTLNGFNRWCLQHVGATSIGWTFASEGEIARAAELEIRLARRESGPIAIECADETNAEEIITRLDCDPFRPDLLIAQRNWIRCPAPNHSFNRMLQLARRHGLTVHVIAVLGDMSIPGDQLWRDAQSRLQCAERSYLRPLPQTSAIERQFGKALRDAGLDPKPQYQVAQYFLDYAVIIQSDEAMPVRLDIEIDGRYWHEELPGHLREADLVRNTTLQRFGWRPVRFWDDEVGEDEAGCISRIRQAASECPAVWEK